MSNNLTFLLYAFYIISFFLGLFVIISWGANLLEKIFLFVFFQNTPKHDDKREDKE